MSHPIHLVLGLFVSSPASPPITSQLLFPKAQIFSTQDRICLTYIGSLFVVSLVAKCVCVCATAGTAALHSYDVGWA